MKLVATGLCLALAACAAAATGPPPEQPSAGEAAYRKCFSCHALEAGRNDLAGPTLHRVIGRRVAAEPGFDYSPALRGFAAGNAVWTRDLLDRFVADPEGLVPGTSMTFHGIRDAAERKAVLDHLERAPQ